MDEGGTSCKTGIYCRGCDYDLRESASRCPECGRAFEAGNAKTYFISPRSRRVRRWIRRVVLLILLILLPPALGLGWLWWGWKQEQGHIAALEQSDLGVENGQLMYPWLPQALPRRWMFLADRADVVSDAYAPLDAADGPVPREAVQHIAGLTRLRVLTIRTRPLTDRDVRELRGLSRLERIWLTGPGITDQALADLAEMKRLDHIHLVDTSITGPGLRQLTAMPRLQSLGLWGESIGNEALTPISGMKQLQELDLAGTRITDEGMKRLAGLSQLRELSLAETKVGDAGLKCLAGMTALETLDLSHTTVTDAGLELLKGLPNLRYLARDGVRISRAAEQRLRRALPQLRIEFRVQRPDLSAPATAPAADRDR